MVERKKVMKKENLTLIIVILLAVIWIVFSWPQTNVEKAKAEWEQHLKILENDMNELLEIRLKYPLSRNELEFLMFVEESTPKLDLFHEHLLGAKEFLNTTGEVLTNNVELKKSIDGQIASVQVFKGVFNDFIKRYNEKTTTRNICSFNRYNCADFSTHAEAQAVFEACGGVTNDIHYLDGDEDGLACETLP